MTALPSFDLYIPLDRDGGTFEREDWSSHKLDNVIADIISGELSWDRLGVVLCINAVDGFCCDRTEDVAREVNRRLLDPHHSPYASREIPHALMSWVEAQIGFYAGGQYWATPQREAV